MSAAAVRSRLIVTVRSVVAGACAMPAGLSVVVVVTFSPLLGSVVVVVCDVAAGGFVVVPAGAGEVAVEVPLPVVVVRSVDEVRCSTG